MVEILHYETVNKNKTIGYVDIKVPITKPTVMIFRRIAHLQSGDKKWFNFPSFSKEINGSISYSKYAQFENEPINHALMNSLHEKIAVFCQANQITKKELFHAVSSQEEEVPF